MKVFFLLAFLLVVTTVHAQEQPGVNCFPIQGQGWSGCVPNYQAQPQRPLGSQPPPGIWVNHWGAIATDFSHGSVGIANNQQSARGAEQATVIACQAKGGVTCKIEITYRNQCAGLVAGTSGHNTKSGSTLAEAIQKAMEVCAATDTDCRAFYDYSGCSLPIRIQ